MNTNLEDESAFIYEFFNKTTDAIFLEWQQFMHVFVTISRDCEYKSGSSRAAFLKED
jgi:hypothetical protein